LPARVHDLLDDGEQVERRARQSVDSRHRHRVAGAERFQHSQQLAPGWLRAAGLLAVNRVAPLLAQLLKLRVERLPVGADAGITKVAKRGALFGHIL